MRHSSLLITVLLTATFSMQAMARTNPSSNSAPDSIIQNYSDSLTALIHRQATTATSGQTMPSPFLFRLLGPGTLFSSALAQQMAPSSSNTSASNLPSLGSTTDYHLLLNEASNTQLSKAYARSPQLFTTTQAELDETGGILAEVTQPIVEEQKLAEKVVEELPDVEVEAVEPEVKRPNFWTFKGNGGLQFTQTYISKNWYKGGINSYAMLSMLTLDANFDNKRKVQLTNRLEARLGFQTTENSVPKFRPTDNLLRFTSNLGIKAIGHWNYAAQLQLQSQPYRGYRGNTTHVNSNFLSPLYVRSSIGMDYNIQKKRFKGTLKLAPLSYVITYVKVDSIAQQAFGFSPGHNARHTWGPNIQFTFDYQITKDIKWSSRFYWFSNFKSTLIENEHTFNFTINKYLSAKLFLYPRYEDTKYYGLSFVKDETGKVTEKLTEESAKRTHWMFQEFLSLGVNYDF